LFDYYIELPEPDKLERFKSNYNTIINSFYYDDAGQPNSQGYMGYAQKKPLQKKSLQKFYPHFSLKNNKVANGKRYHYSISDTNNTQNNPTIIIINQINKMVGLQKYVFLKIYEIMESDNLIDFFCKKAFIFWLIIIFRPEFNFLFTKLNLYNLDHDHTFILLKNIHEYLDIDYSLEKLKLSNDKDSKKDRLSLGSKKKELLKSISPKNYSNMEKIIDNTMGMNTAEFNDFINNLIENSSIPIESIYQDRKLKLTINRTSPAKVEFNIVLEADGMIETSEATGAIEISEEISKDFKTFANDGTDCTSFSNQCMLISILDHLRNKGEFTGTIYEFIDINRITEEEWRSTEDFDTDKGKRQISVLQRICQRYNINLRIKYTSFDTETRRYYLSEEQLIVGNISGDYEFDDWESLANDLEFTLQDIVGAPEIIIVKSSNPNHFELFYNQILYESDLPQEQRIKIH
jgi:hypothetical protein